MADELQLEAQDDTSIVTQETGNPHVGEEESPSTKETPSVQEESEPAPAAAASQAAQEESEAAPVVTERATESSPLAAQDDTSIVTQETGNPHVGEEESPSTEVTPSVQEESEPAPAAAAAAASPAEEESEPAPAAAAAAASPAEEESEPAPAAAAAAASPAEEEAEPAPAAAASQAAQEESEAAPVVTERATESSPLAAQETEASSEMTSELGQVAKQLIPHILNLYNSCATASDFDAIYAPNACFEDPLMQAHGVGQIKSAFYAMPKVFLDSTVLKYTVEEEQTGPKSGEIRLHNLQQYKLLQLGPVGYFVTMQSLIKLKVEGGKVVRHEDLWGGHRLWNRHTVRLPLVGRMAETVRKGSLLLTHVLMGFGKDHRTLDKPRDANTSVRLMVNN